MSRLVIIGAGLSVQQVHAQPSNNLSALVPAYAEMPPTFWEAHKLAILASAITLALLVAVVMWLWLRPKPAPLQPPEKIARAALAKLFGEPEDGRVLSAVSQILRRYISQRFNLPDGELTTTEFTRNLAQAENINLELGETLCSFLRECDVRKFSPANAATPMDAARRALEIVEQVEKQRANQSLLTSAVTNLK